jgi:antitoxin component YwqK of YwqJK toxin-antitoxin module
MTNWIISFLLLFSVSAFAWECPKKTKRINEIAEDETRQIYCLDKKNQKTGPFEIIKDGRRWKAGHFKQDVLQGKFREYSKGKLLRKGQYENGYMQGQWTRYWPNGKVRDRGFWSENQPVGVWDFYNRKGKLIKRKNYSEKNSILSF